MMDSNLNEMIGSFKMQDDLLIVFLGLIIVLMCGIIFFFVRSLIFSQSIEKTLNKKLKNKEFNEVINLAKEYIDQKRRKKADMLFILYYLAQAYEAQSSFASALKTYQDASVLATKNKKLYHTILLHIAKLCDRTGKPRDAMAYYLMIIEQDGNHTEALYDIALIQYKNKNYKKAREYLEKLLKHRGGLLDARFLYGKLLADSGSNSPALKQFKLLEKYDPENFEVFYYKAKVLENIKKYSDAIREYQYVLSHNWNIDENKTLLQIQEQSRIAVINLYIKLKDFHSGIHYVSEFLSEPSSDETKIELVYLYANLLWNTGEEYQALKNFERVFMMRSEYKDASIMFERYKKILPHAYLARYFTSNEEDNPRSFDSCCKKLLGRHNFNLLYRHIDFYIYSKGVFYIVFYRHIEPIAFSKLTDIEVILNSYTVRPQNIEIYSISGVREDAVTHYLLKNSRLIEGDEFIGSVKRSLGAKE